MRWALIAGLVVVSACALMLSIVPILTLIAHSLTTENWQTVPTGLVLPALGLSLGTTTTAAALTVILGTPLAYALARARFPARRALIVAVEWPIVLPPAVAGLALLITFGRRGLFGPALDSLGISLPFTTAAVILAQWFVSAPFYIRSAIVGFQNVPRDIEDAARVDGAAGWALFQTITLPLSARTLLAGLTLSWTRALGEFGATILFAGNLSGRTQTMPLLVYAVFEQNIDAAIWTSVILAGVALIALIGSHWLTRGLTEDDLLSR